MRLIVGWIELSLIVKCLVRKLVVRQKKQSGFLPESPEEVPRPVHVPAPAAGLALGVAGDQGLDGHLHVGLALDRDTEKINRMIKKFGNLKKKNMYKPD